MPHMGKRTAVLIFALSPEEEVKRKSFLVNTSLPIKLNAHIFKVVRKSGLDYFHFNEKAQIGNNFGDRFANAIDAVFSKGYDSIITVGNDSPGLNTEHIFQTANALEAHALVMGPNFDGGFYLMGLQKEYFNLERFKAFSWNSTKLRSDLKTYISFRDKSWYELDFLYDLDRFADLKNVYKTLPISRVTLRKTIQKFLMLGGVFISLNIQLPFLSPTVYPNRGSPSY